ncbi:inositol monophosphatase family protein [Corynebacterium gerontici]|nr:inositol monophosphatase family protein [Corynebacterium gerontici]
MKHPDVPKALGAALKAAQLIKQRRVELNRDSLRVELKSSNVDPVTVVDKESERLIADLLRAGEAEVAILGEEGQAGGACQGGRRWVVDPIDGTVNFLYDSHAYAVSIALEVEGRVELGVVVDVPAGTVFVAALGEGAWRMREGQWERLKCSQPASLPESLVATGFSYSAERRKGAGTTGGRPSRAGTRHPAIWLRSFGFVPRSGGKCGCLL